MNFKIVIQLLLSFLIVFLIVIFFKSHLDEKDNKLNSTNKFDSNLSIENNKNNLVKNITYRKIYNDNGDEFIIKASYGEFIEENSEIIQITHVKAFIHKNDGTIIFITSNNGKYNTKSNDTNFIGDVEVLYQNHKINSEFLDIFFSNNLLKAYENLRYQNLEYKLFADMLDLDLITHNTDIYMLDNSKIKIKKN